jgi:hypothetical protein
VRRVQRIQATALDVPEIIAVADPLPKMLRFLRQMGL